MKFKTLAFAAAASLLIHAGETARRRELEGLGLERRAG